MSVTKTEAIKNFLVANTHSDLAELYNHDMEVQVNVAQGRGERVEGEYKGKKYFQYTDGDQTWKAFRIPFNAYTEPEYTDRPLLFNLSEHAEAIGMTGWDWKNRVSRWVAFDFDAILEHTGVGITPEQLEEVKSKATALEYVTVRASTGGNGLHLYVFLGEPVSTSNHNEHAALSRAILGKMSYDTGFDFEARMDACGGNIWVWGRRMKANDGLRLVHNGIPLIDLPSEKSWRSHIPVVNRRRTTATITEFEDDQEQENYESTSRHRPRQMLEESHKELINWLETNTDFTSYYEQDEQRLITHTLALAEAYKALDLKGVFETASSGSTPQNCFAYPTPAGGWLVRRYGKGVQESALWEKDAGGWTMCKFNTLPTIRDVCGSTGGVETLKGDFEYATVEEMVVAAAKLGVDVEVPENLPMERRGWLSEMKDGRLLLQIDCKGLQNIILPGWAINGTRWTRIFAKEDPVVEDIEVSEVDSIVRFVKSSEGDEVGWFYCSPQEKSWFRTTKDNIVSGLYNLGFHKSEDIKDRLGMAMNNSWTMINEPFRPEYPGNRRWNYRPVRFNYPIKEDLDNLHYPTWMKILNHVGKSLTRVVLEDQWCIENQIETGGEYLKVWCAWMFQKPKQRLPYLFFYSQEQHTGKTTFHDRLGSLIYQGYRRAERSLTSNFNGPLANGVLCALEELDLASNKEAYNKVKDYTTASVIVIRELFCKEIQLDNITHWVQTANNLAFLPIEPNDTRIVVINVETFGEGEVIRTEELQKECDKEASDFLTELVTMELPPTPLDRMALSVLFTQEKEWAERAKETVLQRYMKEEWDFVPGAMTHVDTFCQDFRASLDNTSAERSFWTDMRIKKEMSFELYPRGKATKRQTMHFGNLTQKNSGSIKRERLYLKNGTLIALTVEEKK